MMGLVKYEKWTLEELLARRRELDEIISPEEETWELLMEYEEINEELFWREHPLPERLDWD